jgi:hypothetical protein
MAANTKENMQATIPTTHAYSQLKQPWGTAKQTEPCHARYDGPTSGHDSQRATLTDGSSYESHVTGFNAITWLVDGSQHQNHHVTGLAASWQPAPKK